jgi:hypothetical protein
VRQPSFGATNPLARGLALVLDAAPAELEASRAGHTTAGAGTSERACGARGPEGARWMGVLARADPASPPADAVSAWTAEERG